ncbi:MAG: PKD domain-containing protein, partial [Solirubrobacterales bacterium]|nr:PKD domain-containing protein [Solirubrobacterales bacterium]
MRRYSLPTRNLILALAATLIASLGVVTTAAQAVVITDGPTEAGVSMLPSARGIALPSGVNAVNSGNPCTDPWLSSDLGGPLMGAGGLCWRGGPVMHKNESFALTWDAGRTYWSQTRGYVEQFLRDVADGSGSLGSPYALTTQYNDGGGKAQNASVFGGGCIDYGVTGGSACEFGNPTGTGHDFPSSGCTPRGSSFVSVGAIAGNGVCLTDNQIQSEVAAMTSQTGIIGRTEPGYTPLVTLLMPPGVDVCLDGSNTLCSVNNFLTPPPPTVSTSTTGGTLPTGTYQVEITYMTNAGEQVPTSPQSITTTGGTSSITITSPPSAPTVDGVTVTGWYAYITGPDGFTFQRQNSSPIAIGTDYTLGSVSSGAGTPTQTAFCSYHSQVNVGGTEVAYVVQPWTAGTGCDDPSAPNIPNNPTPQQLAVAVGQRLVNPLSQGQISSIINPALNGWVATSGLEIDDNLEPFDSRPCTPLGNNLDSISLGSSSQNPYFIQREFDNAGALEFDPVTYFGCAPDVILSASFVAPSAVNAGDEVQFDGSSTAATLIVPNAGYAWNFGDGTTGIGPSVVHSYAKGGTYTVTLTVTDRGGNVDAYTQTIQVLGSNGQTVPAPPTSTNGGSGSASGPALSVHLQLLPQSLKSVLSKGIAVRVSSNRPANGIASVLITRAAARRAHIKTGRAPMIRIGLGTVSSITNGTVTLRLHLSPAMAKKLR